METNDVRTLVLKYNEGVADPAEILQLEKLIEEGTVQLSELQGLQQLEKQLFAAEGPLPSIDLDDQFYKMLASEKKKLNKPSFSFQMPDLNYLFTRLAFAAVILVCGFSAGYWLRPSTSQNTEVSALSKEVGDLKEMMMLSLLEKESASERLRAVSLTSDMDQASHKVTSALIQTLNNDPNVNVRLASLDALRPYVRDDKVRKELIMSIAQQESPLIQVALAELMRDIQEKKSVNEFNKIFKGDKVPEEVKNRIREKIQVLI